MDISYDNLNYMISESEFDQADYLDEDDFEVKEEMHSDYEDELSIVKREDVKPDEIKQESKIFHDEKIGSKEIKDNPIHNRDPQMIPVKHRKEKPQSVRESLKICPVCAKEVRHLSHHMKSVHASGEPLNCSQCSSTFKNIKYLKQHVKTAHDSTNREDAFKMCPFCAKEVKHLNNHIRDAHPKDGEAFPCDECGSIFKSKRYLRNHVENIHRIDSKIICPICSKLVNKHHLYTAHGLDTPFICEVCSKTFKTKHALCGHKRKIHSERGRFQCSECGAVFDQAHKLYGHRYAVHKTEEVKCEFCGSNYKNKKLLQAHKRVSHPEQLERSNHAKQLQEMQEYFTHTSQHTKMQGLETKKMYA